MNNADLCLVSSAKNPERKEIYHSRLQKVGTVTVLSFKLQPYPVLHWMKNKG